MKRAIKRVIDGLQRNRGAIDPGVVELLAELVKLAAAVIPGLLKRGKLEEAIEEAARELPGDSRITIYMCSGEVFVKLNCPTYTHLMRADDGMSLGEQVKLLTKRAKEGPKD